MASVLCLLVVWVGGMKEHNGEVVTEKLPREWTLLQWEAGSSCCSKHSATVDWQTKNS